MIYMCLIKLSKDHIFMSSEHFKHTSICKLFAVSSQVIGIKKRAVTRPETKN